jgi:hypothetical protein
MTAAAHVAHHEPGVQPTRPGTRRLVRSGALAGALGRQLPAVDDRR